MRRDWVEGEVAKSPPIGFVGDHWHQNVQGDEIRWYENGNAVRCSEIGYAVRWYENGNAVSWNKISTGSESGASHCCGSVDAS